MKNSEPSLKIRPTVNVFSGSKSVLGAKLTNATCLAVNKGILKQHLPVIYKGQRYDSVEKAYLANKKDSPGQNDQMMVEMICIKFLMHPELAREVEFNGGIDWLSRCDHFTFAKTPSFASWEGKGLESRFIRNLVKGYELSLKGQMPESYEADQASLF